MRRSSRPAPRKAPPSEVLVIGAGAVGAACAAELAVRGARVRVLADPTRSTTRVSGGHLLLQSKKPGPALDLARSSLERIAAFAAGREEELSYRRTGSLLLAADEEEERLLREHQEQLMAAGIPVEWWEPAALREQEPQLSPELRGGTYCPLDGQVDPSALAGAWLQEALLHGAALTSGGRVESFIRSGNAVCGVVAGGMEYLGRAVVLAAGPWSGELAEMAGAPLDIRPRRGVLLRAEVTETYASRPLLGARYLAAKFQANAERGVAFSFQQNAGENGFGGECVLGGSREWAGWSAEPSPELLREIEEEGARYLPAVRKITWDQVSVGFRPWSSSGPRAGISPIPGLFLACGHEGDGISVSAAVALKIADLVLYKE